MVKYLIPIIDVVVVGCSDAVVRKGTTAWATTTTTTTISMVTRRHRRERNTTVKACNDGKDDHVREREAQGKLSEAINSLSS